MHTGRWGMKPRNEQPRSYLDHSNFGSLRIYIVTHSRLNFQRLAAADNWLEPFDSDCLQAVDGLLVEATEICRE